MDPFNNADSSNYRTATSGLGLDSRASADYRRQHGLHQLQKKRSFTAPIHRADRPFDLADRASDIDRRGSSSLADGTKARKGSIRNAVRRIFGRRSREGEPLPPSSPYLPASPEYPEGDVYGFAGEESKRTHRSHPDDLVQRTLSAPTSTLLPESLQLPRSPYGFPQSARLKPLDLGNPYTAPGSQLRRRKSLPSVLINEVDAAAILAEVGASDRGLTSSIDARVESTVEQNDAGKRAKRRSRSANDLRRDAQEARITPRNTKEMRQWRESFAGNVLRASGFTTESSPPAVSSPERIERPGVPLDDSPFETASPRLTTPAHQRAFSERDIGSASAIGTEMSRDLEDRVSRLESGLLSFRGQLAQLSADRNRRTVMIGPPPVQTSAPSLHRSASVLASDLQEDLRPSEYVYDFSRTVGSTSPLQAPRTPTQTDPLATTPNFSIRDRNMPDPFTSPHRQQPSSATLPELDTNLTANREDPSMPADYTFRSLYAMLAEERSARRRLEAQLKRLHEEIASLHQQVSSSNPTTTTQPQSQRNSYYASSNPMVGSSRLHALLRESDASTEFSHPQRDSLRFSSLGQADLMSRFSGSESELGGVGGAGDFEGDDVQSPYEVFQTPAEEQRTFPWDSRAGVVAEDEMF